MDAVLHNLLVTLPSFVVVLSVVVFVHEFGHFIVGRMCGVAAKSFSIGWGSEWFGVTDKHGTRWKVSRIPIGGFVSWIDDADAASVKQNEEFHEIPHEEARRRGFLRAMPLWVRTAVSLAGPGANFIFAIVAFALVTMIVGLDVTDTSKARPFITEIAAGGAAAEAGLKAEETVEAVDGVPMHNMDAFRDIMSGGVGRSFTLTLSDATGARRDVTLAPRPAPGHPDRGKIGVGLAPAPADRVIIAHPDPVTSLRVGAERTWGLISMTFDYVVGIFQGRSSGRDIAGPIGIFAMSGQVTQQAVADSGKAGLWTIFGNIALSLFAFSAMLSVGIGFANLLPIPLLDGGHVVIYAVEALRGGKPLPPNAIEWSYRVGIAMVAGLFLFANWNDISRFLTSGSG